MPVSRVCVSQVVFVYIYIYIYIYIYNSIEVALQGGTAYVCYNLLSKSVYFEILKYNSLFKKLCIRCLSKLTIYN